MLSKESFLLAIIVVSSNTPDLSDQIDKLRGRQIGRLLKLPSVTNVELAVMSSPRVLHLKRSHLGIMDLFQEILFPRYQQQQKPTPGKKTWVPKKPFVSETEDWRKGNIQ
jgi:hypothetical protein